MRASDDVEWIQTFGLGTASFTLYPARVTEKQRKKWDREDAARDKRRTVPFGFRAPRK